MPERQIGKVAEARVACHSNTVSAPDLGVYHALLRESPFGVEVMNPGAHDVAEVPSFRGPLVKADRPVQRFEHHVVEAAFFPDSPILKRSIQLLRYVLQDVLHVEKCSDVNAGSVGPGCLYPK